MIKRCLLWTLAAVWATAALGQNNRIAHVEVDWDWKFQQADVGAWQPATVPGCVHTDLMATQQIPDPFLGQHESECAWVSAADWTYRTAPFDLPRSLRKADRILLRFEGLDTHAHVYFNDQLVIKANNAFVPWEVDVYPHIKRRKNVIRVEFFSPLSQGERLVNACAHPLPGDEIRAVTRKPQYQFGWDWGPSLPSMGISGPVSLWEVNGPRVIHASVHTVSANSSEAMLKVQYEVESTYAQKVQLDVQAAGGKASASTQLNVGTTTVETLLEIKNPQRWWPRELGEQTLTPVICSLNLGTTTLTDTLHTGIRTVELDTSKADQGQQFMLKVNGVPLFCKGANYIPQDVFLHRVKAEDYRTLIEQCVAANFNMLRVWGGGIYERDLFYDLCDEAGILVWQDFMFACAMYPGDEAFIENVRNEANFHIRRLEHHPCMALWCGNNEVSEGWHRWGWQSGLSPEEAEQVWLSYQRLFQAVLPNLVQTHSSIPYWESSPSLGRGDARFQFEGDAHDWTVWHDAAPFERFEQVVPRFMSEFGFQALPSTGVLHQMSNDSLTLDHPDLLSHQKHVRGFELMGQYMERDFGGIPDNLEDYRYLSQYQQMRGMKLGMRAQRMAFPNCTGSLYWQLNDCWPVISWSSLDQDGNWKLLHHEARRSFAPDLLNARIVNDTLAVNLSLANRAETARSTPAILMEGTVTLQTFSGEILAMIPVRAPSLLGRVNRVLEFPIHRLQPDSGQLHLAVVVELQSQETGTLLDTFFPTPPSTWAWPKANIAVEVEPAAANTWLIRLRSDVFVTGVELQADHPGRFSDNGFTLRPGWPYEVYFEGDSPVDTPNFGFRHLGEVQKRLP